MDITILGLGPGDSSLLTVEARDTLDHATEIHVRTRHHPTVSSLPPRLAVHSFDYLYESEDDFSAVYEEIAKEVLRLARRPEGVIYAVPGHPLVGEESVRRILALAKGDGLQVRMVIGLSFIEAALIPLELDPLDGLQVVDATVLAARLHPSLDPDLPALVGQMYDRRLAAEVKLTLMNLYPADHVVTLVRNLGTSQAHKQTLPLCELDHLQDMDYLTTLYLPPLPRHSSLATFQDIVARLRAPGGCPWDQEQTHQTLRTHLLEETYEVLEALDKEDEAALCEELGDLLLQIILHAQIATEEGEFTLPQVLETIIAKIVRRHPHVFANLQVTGADEVLRNWQAIKLAEKPAEKQALLGTPLTLPALALAQRVQQRAEQAGLALQTREQLFANIEHTLSTLTQTGDPERATDELGRLLFALAELGRQMGVDAESALRSTTGRFGDNLDNNLPSVARDDDQPRPPE